MTCYYEQVGLLVRCNSTITYHPHLERVLQVLFFLQNKSKEVFGGAFHDSFQPSSVVRNHRKRKRNSCCRSQEGLSLVLYHNFGSRFGRPVERMSMRIPFHNKGHQPFSQVIQVSEVADTQPLALHNAEPLFDLVHPRAMHWQKQYLERDHALALVFVHLLREPLVSSASKWLARRVLFHQAWLRLRVTWLYRVVRQRHWFHEGRLQTDRLLLGPLLLDRQF